MQATYLHLISSPGIIIFKVPYTFSGLAFSLLFVITQTYISWVLILRICNWVYVCCSAGIVICNWCVMLSVLITVWCTFDAAGRSWVKMKKYQRSMREAESRFQYKRSGTRHRNWRQRYATCSFLAWGVIQVWVKLMTVCSI